MGRDLCLAILEFANVSDVDTALPEQAPAPNLEKLKQPVTTQRTTQSIAKEVDDTNASSKIKKSAIEIIPSYSSSSCLDYASLFSEDAVRAACATSQRRVNTQSSGNVSDNAISLRLQTEMFIRKVLKLDRDLMILPAMLPTIDLGDEDLPRESDVDEGSDSDPSGDNLPVDVILRRGTLGSRVNAVLAEEIKNSKKKLFKKKIYRMSNKKDDKKDGKKEDKKEDKKEAATETSAAKPKKSALAPCDSTISSSRKHFSARFTASYGMNNGHTYKFDDDTKDVPITT